MLTGAAHVEGPTVAQAVSRQPFTVEAQVQSYVCLSVLFVVDTGTQIGFFPPNASVFLSLSFHRCSLFIHRCQTLYAGVLISP